MHVLVYTSALNPHFCDEMGHNYVYVRAVFIIFDFREVHYLDCYDSNSRAWGNTHTPNSSQINTDISYDSAIITIS